MAPPSERSEGHRPADPPTQEEGFALVAKPYERPQLTQTPDGGFTIFFRGEIRIAYRPPATDAPESPVPEAREQTGSQIPEHTSPPVTDRHSAADKPSWEQSRSAFTEMPESENEKFQLVGNPARKLRYRVTKRTNTKIADFVLATHPEEEKTEYWRIRAFGKEAEKVRDQVAVGQKGVEVTVYGPKYWEGQKKTTDGTWEDTVVKGYHAGFVNVPKKYRKANEVKPT